MEAPKQRKEYIDILKGIGIWFVVFGHITHIGFLREYIWNFHMPLFFWVSGLLFNRSKYSNFKNFALHRINTIILPYIIFFAVTFLYYVFIERRFRGGEYSIEHQLLGLLYGTYEGNHLLFNGALWFLPCLFSVEMIFWMISKAKDVTAIAALLILCYVAGAIINVNQLNFLPWGLHTALFAVVFYGIGFLSKKSVTDLSTTSSLPSKILLIISCLSLQLFCIGKYSSIIEKSPLYYIPLALCGIALYLTLSILLKSNKVLEYLGKNSIVILAFQEQTYRATIFGISKILSIDSEVIRNNFLYCIIISILSLVIIWPFIILYNKFVRPRLSTFK